MKNLFTAFAFSGLLLAGCNSFNTKLDEVTRCTYCGAYNTPNMRSAIYTNTSTDKYLEVTFNTGNLQIFRKLKPGETTGICITCEEEPPVVVGEREITNN